MEKIHVKSLLFMLFSIISFTVFSQNDVVYISGTSEKIEQVVGDEDFQTGQPTSNLTDTNYDLPNTDLGVPFEHNGKTYVLFGDVWIQNDDPIGYTTDTNPENGIEIDFIVDSTSGDFRTTTIPGVELGGLGVPFEGVSWNGNMYVYASETDMASSVLAKSTDDGYTFTKLYDLPSSKFINVSVRKIKSNEFYPETLNTDIQVMFGSGEYRESDVYLAYQRADQIENNTRMYFAGLDNTSRPTWSSNVADAEALFDQPCVGEISVVYNNFLGKWMMFYNCDASEGPRGINCRTAERVWGPWSDPFVIFHPWDDNAYCEYMHTSYQFDNCDSLQYPGGRSNKWGGEYGPYQYPNLSTGDNNQSTIYYNMSTWNPYTVVLMKSQLRKIHFEEGTYRLVARHSGKALGNANYPSSGIDNVLQWTHLASNMGQNWDLEPIEDGYYKIISSLSGYALTVESCATGNGSNIKQEPYNALDCQLWLIEKEGSYYRIVSKETGKVLEIDGGSISDGANAELNTWNSNNYQQWSIYPYFSPGTYRIVAEHSGKYLDNSYYTSTSSKNVHQWEENELVAQDWDVELLDDGYYKITSLDSDSVLSVQNCSTTSGGNIRQESWSNSDCQKWLIESEGPHYRITSKHSGMVVTVEDGGGSNAENVEQTGWSNVPWKKWNFITGSGSGSRIAEFSELADDASHPTNLKVYPNPVSNRLNIDYSSKVDTPISVKVIDILGKKVIERRMSVASGQNKITLETERLTKGVYFLKLISQKEQLELTRKIIVE